MTQEPTVVPSDATSAFPSGTRLLRPRLLAALDRRERVTVVKAEGGAGKTSLVEAWLESADDTVPTAWVTLDENCRSRRSFWHRLLLTLLGREIITEGSALGRYAIGEANTSSAPALVVDEFRLRPEGLRLVVDNLHFLDDDAQRELAWVLRQTPRLEFIAMSRNDTVVDTGTEAALLGTAVIGSPELALSVDELARLSERLGARLTMADIARLHDVTRGHVLSSRLALSALLAQHIPAVSSVDARSELVAHVAGIVSHDFLPSFTSERRADDACRIAIPLHVDRELAEAIVGTADVWELVESLVDQGAGAFRDVDGRTVFSFHPLVRGALTDRASRTLSETDVREASRIAAAHLASWGDPVEVIRLLIAAGEHERVWPFFVREFSALSVHRVDDVIRVLEVVPDEVLAQHGTLAVALAVELSEREARPSTRVTTLASWALAALDRQEPSADPVQRVLVLIARFGAYRAARRYAEAADAGAEIAQQLAALDDDSRAQIGTGAFTALMQVVITDVLDGRLDAAAEHAAGMTGDLHPGRRTHLTSMLAYARALDGEMPAAAGLIARLPANLPPTWPTTINAIGWNCARSLLFLEAGDTTAAAAALDPLAGRAEFFEHWAMLLWTRGLIHLVEGDAAAGLDDLSRALRRAQGRVASATHLDQLRALHADLALRAGEPQEADAILDDAEHGSCLLLSLARRRLVADDAEGALETVLRARRLPRTTRQLADGELTAAVALARLARPDDAARRAKRAAAVLRQNRLTSPLAFLPRGEIEPLLAPHGFPWPAHIDPSFASGEAALSPREVLVLRQLGSGGSLAEISERLFVSPNTVKSQVRSLYRKLGVSRRADALAVARARGLV